mmetsp:Transcript_6325/g.17665  ORF Transcript_6325/g.17665 Transcript_6325/m.17665 type:complete len:254 (-) Transcript_6325:614-1375(-)
MRQNYTARYLLASLGSRLLQLSLQFRRTLAILPVTIFLAIPMHLLTLAAEVAVGTTPTAELAVLALESGTASSAGISQQAKFAANADKRFDAVNAVFHLQFRRSTNFLIELSPKYLLGFQTKLFVPAAKHSVESCVFHASMHYVSTIAEGAGRIPGNAVIAFLEMSIRQLKSCLDPDIRSGPVKGTRIESGFLNIFRFGLPRASMQITPRKNRQTIIRVSVRPGSTAVPFHSALKELSRPWANRRHTPLVPCM